MRLDIVQRLGLGLSHLTRAGYPLLPAPWCRHPLSWITTLARSLCQPRWPNPPHDGLTVRFRGGAVSPSRRTEVMHVAERESRGRGKQSFRITVETAFSFTEKVKVTAVIKHYNRGSGDYTGVFCTTMINTACSIGWKRCFCQPLLINTDTAALSELIDLNPVIQAVMFDVSKLFVNRGINEVPMCPTFVKSNRTTCEAFKQRELRNYRATFSQGKLW